MAEIIRQPALAQFNKINKKFITVLSMVEDTSLLNHDFYDYQEVSIDPYNETIQGDYNNFQIIDLNKQPLEITEDMLNELARDKIVKEYPIERQLTVLGTVLEKIVDQTDIEAEELKTMNDYIAEIKRTNSIRKQFYANNADYDYKSTEELDALIQEKYEGSIQAYNGEFTSL